MVYKKAPFHTTSFSLLIAVALAAGIGTAHAAQSRSAPASQPSLSPAAPPLAGDICRAGVALANHRQLREIRLDSVSANVYTVSYIPWPGAPPNARVVRCKLLNNAVVLGDMKGSRVRWKATPMPYTTNKASEELSMRIYFSTGKSKTQVFTFDALKTACPTCSRVAKPSSV